MPDRAVVDDDHSRLVQVPTCRRCGGPLTKMWDPGEGEVWTCENSAGTWTYGKPSDMGLPDPQPRALVALSEDRQWLVVACRSIKGYTPSFSILRCKGGDYLIESFAEDTGQDAQDVLRAFLEGRS